MRSLGKVVPTLKEHATGARFDVCVSGDFVGRPTESLFLGFRGFEHEVVGKPIPRHPRGGVLYSRSLLNLISSSESRKKKKDPHSDLSQNGATGRQAAVSCRQPAGRNPDVSPTWSKSPTSAFFRCWKHVQRRTHVRLFILKRPPGSAPGDGLM